MRKDGSYYDSSKCIRSKGRKLSSEADRTICYPAAGSEAWQQIYQVV